MKPKVRFKGFDDDWKINNIKGLGVINPKEELPTEFQYVDLESVMGTELISYRIEHKASAPSRAQRLAKKGDIFYQTVRPYQKNNYLFDIDEKNFVFSTGYAQIRPNINGLFLFTLLQNDKFVNEVLLNCTGTSYPAINSTDLSNIEILISNNNDEQKAIGEYFRKLDGLIRDTEKEIGKLENLKQASLQKMFPQPGELVPQLRFKGFSEPWQEKRLGEIGYWIKGQPLSKEDIVSDGMYKCLHYGQLFSEGERIYNISTYTNKLPLCLSEGTVLLIPDSDVTPDGLGRCSSMQEKDVIIGSGINILKLQPYLDPHFCSLNVSLNKRQIIERVTGTTVRHIHAKDLSEIMILLPSLGEQKAIGDYFRNLDNIISAKKKELEKLRQVKSSCLNLMFV